MPFIDLSLPERDNFLKSFTECHIPGYTGHCPTLKFHHGKGFGADTRDIIRKLKDRSLTFDMKPYKQGDPVLSPLRETKREKDEEFDPSIYTNLPRRPYILGYTGFIPGLNFRYGSSFTTAANESIHEFTNRLLQERKRRERNLGLMTLNKGELMSYSEETPSFLCRQRNQLAEEQDLLQFSNASTKMASVRNRDEVKKMLQSYANRTSIKPETKISFELPPIAGYTGHIPRLIGSETSLSRRYHTAAKAGLAQLKEATYHQGHFEMAQEAVKNAINCSHSSR